MKESAQVPRYVKIAHDIASKIVDGVYPEGEKIYVRSYLASQYGVSPETARRAMCVLADLNIVESTKGSGVIIKSVENARFFINQHANIRTVDQIRTEIKDSVRKQQQEIEHYLKCVDDLMYKIEKFRMTNPFIPFHVYISDSSPYINLSVSDINLWHHTHATVIAIKRNGELLISPGPYAVLENNDIFYFIGDEESEERVKKFIYPGTGQTLPE